MCNFPALRKDLKFLQGTIFVAVLFFQIWPNLWLSVLLDCTTEFSDIAHLLVQGWMLVVTQELQLQHLCATGHTKTRLDTSCLLWSFLPVTWTWKSPAVILEGVRTGGWTKRCLVEECFEEGETRTIRQYRGAGSCVQKRQRLLRTETHHGGEEEEKLWRTDVGQLKTAGERLTGRGQKVTLNWKCGLGEKMR